MCRTTTFASARAADLPFAHQPAGRRLEQLHVRVPGTATSAGRQEGRYAYRVASSRTVAMSLNGSSSSLTIW